MVSFGAGIGIVPRLVLESSPLRASVREIKGIRPPPGYEVSLCPERETSNAALSNSFGSWPKKACRESLGLLYPPPMVAMKFRNLSFSTALSHRAS